MRLLKPWLSNSYKDWRDTFESEKSESYEQFMTFKTETSVKMEKKQNKQIDRPNRILVCASSNTAVDQILK